MSKPLGTGGASETRDRGGFMPAPADPWKRLENGRLVVLADAGRRFWARVIDMAVLIPALWMVLGALWSLIWHDFALFDRTLQSDPPAQLYVLLWAGLAMLVLYEPVTVALCGATVGKLAMGIRVVRIADASAPGLARSLARVLVPNAAGVLTFGIGWFVVWIVLYLSLVFDWDERGWHDKLAGTVVVTKASVVSAGGITAGRAGTRAAQRRDRERSSMDERWQRSMSRGSSHGDEDSRRGDARP
ncbi:RDD family protein [Candidatus Poriferisodalis sp.]|uniref:RDD family protein n=1 Tax=Candidatus Poriferisodalis sp. TaxID=3101277 RepID=UPI003B018411